EVRILDNTAPPTALILAEPDDFLDCIIVNVSLSGQPQDNSIYLWDIGGDLLTAEEITISNPGLYGLTVIDTLSGCQARDSILIDSFEEYPIISIAEPDTLNCNRTSITIDASASQQGSTIAYQWLDADLQIINGATTDILNTSFAGTYYLQLVDTANGCENIDTVFVSEALNFPEIILSDEVILNCGETQGVMSAALAGELSEVTISWSSADGQLISGVSSLNPQFDGLGTYLISAQDLNTGCVSVDSIMVSTNTNQPQGIILSLNDESCLDSADGFISIESIVGGTAPYTFELGNNQNENGIFTNLAVGEYILSTVDANGCRLDSSVTIQPGLDLSLSLPPTLEIEENERGILAGLVNVDESELSLIQWTPAEAVDCSTCLETTFWATTSQNLSLTVVHENGCIATASVQVLVNPQADVFIPNAFSPDGDGRNDRFLVFANSSVITVEEMMIADRWGEILYRREDLAPNAPSEGWDGTFLGQPMNAGVYVYLVRVRLRNGKEEIFKGDVTLLR
ncbi:MAG: gliding motility-associated C-terminal domain-containing protein, partial [Bacteroidota bacterium]